MNCILYNFIQHKKVNGTLFYCFEYYVFIKEKYPDLKFVLFNASEDDLEFIKNIFLDKYNFNIDYLNDFIGVQKYTEIPKLNIKNTLIFDANTINKLSNFIQKSNKLFYSNEIPKVNDIKNITYYGFYDSYQKIDKRVRLKLYKQIHKTFDVKGNKTFISSPLEISKESFERIIIENKLNKDNIFVKKNNKHYNNLFEEINKIIYFSTILDKNNRLVVESAIHNIPVIVYHNGNVNDSVYERHQCIESGNLNELLLDDSDILVNDFLKAVNDKS